MKKKKVIAFLVKYKFTQTDFASLNCKNLCKIFNIKFLDITRITIKKKLQILQSKIKKKRIIYTKILNMSDLKKNLIDVDFVFDCHNALINDNIINKFFNNTTQKDSKVLGIIGGSIPNFFNHTSIQKFYFFFIFIIYIFKYKKFSIITRSLTKFLIIYFKSLNKKYRNYNFSYDYVLCDSDISEKSADRYFNNSKKIYVHYKDYERHLLQSNNSQSQNNYAVFLDEAIFNHPDNFEIQPDNLSNLKKNINLYFKDLNKFFYNYECHNSSRIIIAAHPKGFLNFDYENYFSRRKIIRNNSYELIKKSQLVFAHSSSSVAYAVMLKKPIIFLNSHLMFDIGYFSKILSFSIETGGKMIDINNDNIDYNNLVNQNFSLYKNYLNKFVKSSKSKNKYIWDIVGSKLNNL
jgi:hypothetical protein